MSALTRIGVFEKVRAIKLREAMRITRKMGRRPIEKNADAFLVAAIDEIHEIGGRSETAGGGGVAERLLAPGAVKGMVHDREEVDVGVAEIFDEGDWMVSEFEG